MAGILRFYDRHHHYLFESKEEEFGISTLMVAKHLANDKQHGLPAFCIYTSEDNIEVSIYIIRMNDGLSIKLLDLGKGY